MLGFSLHTTRIVDPIVGSTLHANNTIQISPCYPKSLGGESQGFQRMDTLSLTKRNNAGIWLDRSWASLAKTSERLGCLQAPCLWSRLLVALIWAIKCEISR